MARPKKIKIEETPVEVVDTPVIVEETPVITSERSKEYYRVVGVYEDFKRKYPAKWEVEKEVLLKKLELL